MKKSKIKILLISFFLILLSCDNKTQFEKSIIATEKDYWQYNDDCESHGVYFQFNEGGDYNKYNRYIDNTFELFNDDGDIIGGVRSWSMKNDSIFIWDNEEYKIEKSTDKQIVLTYYHHKEKNQKCKITLNKVSQQNYKE